MTEDFGPRLRRLRKAQKLTLQQVADTVGCTKSYIWELEMKEGQRPSAKLVYALAKVLGVTIEGVMGFMPLYTKPHQWQELTFADIDDLGVSKDWIAGARWAEAKLKEKNGD